MEPAFSFLEELGYRVHPKSGRLEDPQNGVIFLEVLERPLDTITEVNRSWEVAAGLIEPMSEGEDQIDWHLRSLRASLHHHSLRSEERAAGSLGRISQAQVGPEPAGQDQVLAERLSEQLLTESLPPSRFESSAAPDFSSIEAKALCPPHLQTVEAAGGLDDFFPARANEESLKRRQESWRDEWNAMFNIAHNNSSQPRRRSTGRPAPSTIEDFGGSLDEILVRPPTPRNTFARPGEGADGFGPTSNQNFRNARSSPISQDFGDFGADFGSVMQNARRGRRRERAESHPSQEEASPLVLERHSETSAENYNGFGGDLGSVMRQARRGRRVEGQLGVRNPQVPVAPTRHRQPRARPHRQHQTRRTPVSFESTIPDPPGGEIPRTPPLACQRRNEDYVLLKSFKHKKKSDQDEEEDVCPICLDPFVSGTQLAETSCGHKFHVQCIKLWLQKSWICPLCRRELSHRKSDI
mmetsp:Transcript_13273/g.17498  ORF Transcript_13273/g.17498 Transcript_13273/m.17498 type:complete len:467 (+) Transcript_13273:188-1588(+)